MTLRLTDCFLIWIASHYELETDDVFKYLTTPRAGFEPATSRLTVDRSTTELPRIMW
jgi:hypothetical protein